MFSTRHIVDSLSSCLFYIVLGYSKVRKLVGVAIIRFILSVFILPLAAFLFIDWLVGYKRSIFLNDVEFETTAENFFSMENFARVTSLDISNNGVQNFGLSTRLTVSSGQNLASMLKSLDISENQIGRLLSDKSIRGLVLLPDNELLVNYDCDMEYAIDKISEDGLDLEKKYNLPLKHTFRKKCWLVDLAVLQKDRIVRCIVDKNGKLTVATKKIEFKKAYRVVSGEIRNSLYADAVSAGVPASVIMQAISQYSFIIDLQRDIKSKDSFVFVFHEILSLDNAIVGSGDLVFANLILGKGNNEIHLFKGQYYNKKGESIKKSLLKTPVDGARITSGFGTRKHPILGYTKKHQGIDFGAPTGTPIYAAGDGVIEFVGVRGGYGKFISLRHNRDLCTNYAHLSKFSPFIAKGVRVFQKQVIGYVGATGQVTGPHLHFEVEVKGRKVNPSSTYLTPGKKLTNAELNEFKHQQSSIQKMISGNI